MTEDELLERITVDPAIFGGKPIIQACLAYAHRSMAGEQVQERIASETLVSGRKIAFVS